MKKKAALSYFITLSILIVISFIFSFVSFSLPSTNYQFKGFLNSINKDIDFGGGTVGLYDIEKHYFDGSDAKAMNATLNRLSELLNKNYIEPRILETGDNNIKVLVPGDDINTNYLVGIVEFATDDLQGHDNTEDHDHSDHVKLNGSHIDHAKYVSTNGVPTVWIEFTKEGKKILHEITKEFSHSSPGTIYCYVNQDYDNYLLQVQLEDPVDKGFIQLSGGSLITRANAEEIVNKVESGKLGVNMALVGELESVDPIVHPTIVIIIELAFFAIILISFMYLYKKYKQLGLVAILSICVFLSLSFIMLPILNIMILSFASIAASTMLYLSVFALHVLFIENIKNEFEGGRRFIAAFKNGYLKTIPMLIDFFSVLFAMSLFGYIFAGGVFKNIAAVFLPGSIIAALVLFLVFRGITKWYLVLNNSKYKKVNFNKAGVSNEK